MLDENNVKIGNGIIAEFMGKYDTGLLGYDTSWDWLMDVVDKLESLGYWTSFKTHYVRINPKEGNYDECIVWVGYGSDGYYSYRYLDDGIDYIQTDLFRGKEDINKRQAVWLAVVETLRWCNEAQKVKI